MRLVTRQQSALRRESIASSLEDKAELERALAHDALDEQVGTGQKLRFPAVRMAGAEDPCDRNASDLSLQRDVRRRILEKSRLDDRCDKLAKRGGRPDTEAGLQRSRLVVLSATSFS